MSKTAGHKMEAHINFFPKTKQLRKFKLFESKEVSHTVLTYSSNTFWSGQTKSNPSFSP